MRTENKPPAGYQVCLSVARVEPVFLVAYNQETCVHIERRCTLTIKLIGASDSGHGRHEFGADLLVVSLHGRPFRHIINSVFRVYTNH
jgi:hypothetical protein